MNDYGIVLLPAVVFLILFIVYRIISLLLIHRPKGTIIIDTSNQKKNRYRINVSNIDDWEERKLIVLRVRKGELPDE